MLPIELLLIGWYVLHLDDQFKKDFISTAVKVLVALYEQKSEFSSEVKSP